MKYLLIATLSLAVLGTPAMAGGRGGSNGLDVNAGITTGKGGVIGALLGSNGRGNTGLNVNVAAVTGKGGVLGLLTGGSKSNGHGW